MAITVPKSAFLTFFSASYLFMLAEHMDRGQGDHGSVEFLMALLLAVAGATLLWRRNTLRATAAITFAFLALQPLLVAVVFWAFSWIHCSEWFLQIHSVKISMLPCNCAPERDMQSVCGG